MHIVKHFEHRKKFAQQFLGTSIKLNVLGVETDLVHRRRSHKTKFAALRGFELSL